MGAIVNGMSLHGTLLPYGGTFLIFSDYMRPPIRLAALMGIPAIFVFTHDSIFLGEDGPTHQPVEQLPALRMIPNIVVLRPADGPETAISWSVALRRRSGPTVLAFTRQNLPPIPRSDPASVRDTAKGGYVVISSKSKSPAVVLIGTGSELHLAVAARERLATAGHDASVVSMPSLELFATQPRAYREQVIPRGARAVAIEAAHPGIWYRWIGSEGLAIGVERFGASAPYQAIADHLGFTPEKVTARILDWLGK
jgi:transketolase